MLTNTINVGSWLLLNALVPAALPESVSKQYKDQFVDWPPISAEAQWDVMFPAIKSLRFLAFLAFLNNFKYNFIFIF
jgi:hypothetical protein